MFSHDVPDEVFSLIFEYLGLLDVSRVEKSCKKFQNCLKNVNVHALDTELDFLLGFVTGKDYEPKFLDEWKHATGITTSYNPLGAPTKNSEGLITSFNSLFIDVHHKLSGKPPLGLRNGCVTSEQLFKTMKESHTWNWWKNVAKSIEICQKVLKIVNEFQLHASSVAELYEWKPFIIFGGSRTVEESIRSDFDICDLIPSCEQKMQTELDRELNLPKSKETILQEERVALGYRTIQDLWGVQKEEVVGVFLGGRHAYFGQTKRTVFRDGVEMVCESAVSSVVVEVFAYQREGFVCGIITTSRD